MADGVGTASRARFELLMGKPVVRFAASRRWIVPALCLADDDAEQLPLAARQRGHDVVKYHVGNWRVGRPHHFVALARVDIRRWLRRRRCSLRRVRRHGSGLKMKRKARSPLL